MALVDDEDYELVSRFRWGRYADKRSRTVYARAWINPDGSPGKQSDPGTRKIRMHVLITGHKNMDHSDRDGLNNQRANLREATRSEQQANQEAPCGNFSSKFKGVTWDKQHQKWRAQIMVDGKYKHLGLFEDEIEAVKAYDATAREAWGEFAYTNFWYPKGYGDFS